MPESSTGSTLEQSATINVVGVHHIAIRVQDLEASVKWWEQVFGIRFTDLPATNTNLWRGAPESGFLKAAAIGNFYFVFAPPLDGVDREAKFTEKQIGMDHFSFAVADRGELEALVTRLKSAGSPTEGIEHDPVLNTDYVCFRDPNNLQIEVFLV